MFNPERLSLIVQPIGDGGLRFFGYQTDDAEATVTAAGYATDAAGYGLRAYDLIFVSPLAGAVEPYILAVDAIDADGHATLASPGPIGDLKSANNLSDIASAATARTNLGLGSAAVLNAGSASGNLKALNADGGFEFNLTGAPTIDIDSQAFGGTWKTHHYYKAETTGAHAGTGRWATGIEHIAQGSTGASGATNLDGGLWVEAGKLNWNTDQTIEGPITTLYVIGTDNAWSDLGGVIVNVSKPMTTTPGTFGGGGVDGNGSIVAWESTSRAYNMAGDTIIRDIHCLIGWDMVNLPGSALAAGSNVGFLTEPVVGDSFSAFVANGRSDLAGTPDFQYLFVHSTNRNAANIDFHITGPKHADGAGLIRAGDGTTAKPAYSFDADDDCGMFRSAANTIAFATNGVTRLTMDGGNVRSPLSLYAHNATVIPAGGTAGAGFRFSSTANFGVFFGSGAPTLSAAKGSLYLRSDGTTTNDRAYINTDSATTWTALTTAA